MKSAVLITDELHPLLKEGLEHDGFTVNYSPGISPDEVLQIIPDYEGVVVNSKVYVGREIFDRAVKLKFVCRAGSGLEVVDMDYAKNKNIVVFNSPEGSRNAVAEHALGMLLNLMNNISIANEQVKKYQWIREANRGHELSGKTISFIAFGNTAEAFSDLLSGFEVKKLAYDKYRKNFSSSAVHESTLEQIFEEADIVSVHLPLTSETEYMIDYKFLSSFKKPVWLINTSRGKVLRTEDLVQCINEGKILGAALDVLENEKLSHLNENERQIFEKLISDKRILFTPHIAGWTHESKQKIAAILLQKIRNIYSF